MIRIKGIVVNFDHFYGLLFTFEILVFLARKYFFANGALRLFNKPLVHAIGVKNVETAKNSTFLIVFDLFHTNDAS